MNAPDQQQIDPRLALLARAWAWFVLVEDGLATLEEAFEALTPAFEAAVPCACDRDPYAEFDTVPACAVCDLYCEEMVARWETPPRLPWWWDTQFRVVRCAS